MPTIQPMTPGHKAQHTAKWARTMTKWLITFNRRKGVKWNLVEFGGKTKSEASARHPRGLKRGSTSRPGWIPA